MRSEIMNREVDVIYVIKTTEKSLSQQDAKNKSTQNLGLIYIHDNIRYMPIHYNQT